MNSNKCLTKQSNTIEEHITNPKLLVILDNT